MPKNKTDLTIPCTYQGSKQRIAKDIVDVLLNQNSINKNTKFYDMCCGSGTISVELINRGIKPQNITMVDLSPWGKFWQSVGSGNFKLDTFKELLSEVPNDITKIKGHMDKLSKQDSQINEEYVFIILQSASFGGKPIWITDNKWKNHGFRDYWLPTETSVRRSPVNPMSPMPNTLLDRMKVIIERVNGVNAIQSCITSFSEFDKNSIVYIDPPYDNTTGYGYTFDLNKYIEDIGVKCYVSEGKQVSNNAVKISKGKDSGITGKRKLKHEEWLNIFE